VRAVGVTLFALLLVVTGVLIWLLNDTERLRHAVESFVSAISDRPFTIEGEFDFELGRITTVRANKIYWRNSSSTPAPFMLEVGQFTGSIDLFSLFEQPVVITDVQVRDASVLLAWNDDGDFNWRLAPAVEVQSNRAEPSGSLPLLIEKSTLQNVSVRFHHPGLTEDLKIIVQSAQQQRGEAEQLVLSAVALLEEQSFAIDGQLGPFSQLAEAGAVDFDLSILGRLAAFTTSGGFARLAELRGPDLVAELTAPSAVALAEALKLPLETTGNVQLGVKIVTRGDGIEATASGSFGGIEIDTGVRMDSLITLQGLDASLSSRGPSIRGVASLAGLSDFPDKPYKFDAHLVRTDRGIELQKFTLETAGLNVDGKGIVGAVPGFRDIDLELTATGSSFATVSQWFDLGVEIPSPFELKAVVAGNGPDKDGDIDARLKLGNTMATLRGSIGGARDLSGSELRFSVDAPDANQLARAVGIAAPAGAALRARGSSAITAQRVSFEALELSVGDATLTGSAWLDRKSESPGFNFNGQAKGPDFARILGPMLPVSTRSLLPQLPFTVNTKLRLTPGSLEIATVGAKLGKSELTFSGQVATGKRDPKLTGELSARGDSLSELLGGLGTGYIPDKAFSVKSRLGISRETIRIDQLSFKAERATIEANVVLSGDGYSQIAFDVKGSGESLRSLIPENDAYRPADVPFSIAAKGTTNLATITADRFHAQLGDAELEFSGEMQLKPALAAKGIRLKGSGVRLSDLGEVGELKLTDRPFQVSASMAGDAREQVIEELHFVSGENNVHGRLRLRYTKVPAVEITLESSRLNLDEIRVPDAPADTAETAAPGNGRLFSDEPLPFERLDDFDAEINVKIDDLVSRGYRWRDLAVDASLKKSVLEVRRAEVEAAKGKVNARGTMKPTPQGRAIVVEITAADAMVALYDMTPEELDQLPRHAMTAQLSAVGNTPHEIAASLDGFVWIISGQGLTRRRKLGPLIGDFLTELFVTVNPTVEKQKYAAVDCQGLFVEITNGTIETAPGLVIRTDYVVILAEGRVDLASEKIDFTFETTPVKGLGVSVSDYATPFTKLGGTLRDPHLVFDAKNSVVEGGVAVATLGLSILAKSLWKSWFGTQDICKKVAEKAIEIRTKRNPDDVPDLKKLIAGTQRPETK